MNAGDKVAEVIWAPGLLCPRGIGNLFSLHLAPVSNNRCSPLSLQLLPDCTHRRRQGARVHGERLVYGVESIIMYDTVESLPSEESP